MFIKIKVDTDRDTSMDEALINTDQITWIDIEDKRIRFADASFIYVPKSELDKVIMATTEKVIIGKKELKQYREWLESFNPDSATDCFTAVRELKRRVKV